MPASNEDIARLFENMATLLEMKGDSVFKIRAYQRAARTIEHLSLPLFQAVAQDADLKKIPSIGKAISDKIRETGTALEINASPERLDLKDTHAYRARELGVPLVISTDSHHHPSIANRRFGVGVARRAWCEPRHILNTLPREQFLRFIRTPKPERIEVFQVFNDSRLQEAQA